MVKTVSQVCYQEDNRYPTGRGKNKRYVEWPAEGLTLDHIADKPMTFHSKKDLKTYCDKHGLSAGALS